MHKIVLFISFISANIQTVLISYYLMDRRFAHAEVFGAGAHGTSRTHDILPTDRSPPLNAVPHRRSPAFSHW